MPGGNAKQLPVQEIESTASHNLFSVFSMAGPLDTYHPHRHPMVEDTDG